MEKRFWFGFVGALLLGFGAFAPIIRAPIIGSLSYFNNGKGDGIIIIVLALGALILTIAKKYEWLSFIGMCSIAMLVYTFLNVQTRLNQLSQNVETELRDNPFKGLASLAVQSIQFEWGLAIMLIGAACLITAAFIKSQGEDEFNFDDDRRTACLYCAERIMVDAEICRYCGQEQPTDALPESVECPACGTELELNIKERKEKVYSCDECGSVIDVRGKSSRI